MKQFLYFPKDVERLVRVAYEHGVDLDHFTAQTLWQNRWKGWQVVPDNDEKVWEYLRMSYMS